ncbi:MAG: ABC transporter permease [Tannerella sp.]|jgi:ABC-2 type transport system permease protein|nr:ABC transporter permease [Tannerella sp.]
MKALKYLLKKEFLQIFRNKFMFRFIFLLPVVQLAVLPWAATFEQKDISLCVIDNDQSASSVRLREKALSSGFFRLSSAPASYDEALRDVELGKADLILEIAQDFEKNLVNGVPARTMLSIDALNGQKAGLAMAYMTQIINDFNPGAARQAAITVKPYYKYNPAMSYRNFMVPGVIVILISMIGAMFSAMNIVREKELGTMEQINVTPVSRSAFILAKLIPFWVIGLVNLTLSMAIAFLIYGMLPAGAVANIYLFAFFYLLAFTGFGLMISNFAKNQQQAMFMTLFFLICFILLSGLFTPIGSMPDWAQAVTAFNPLRYFVEVMRLIYLKGSGFADILPQLLKIGGFLIVFNLMAVASYRKVGN